MKLLERKQVGTIYHFTYLDKLIEILKSNSLKSYSKENRDGVNTSYIPNLLTTEGTRPSAYTAIRRASLDG